MLPANANYEMRNSRTVCLRKKRLNTLIHTRKPRDFSILGNVLRLNPIRQEKFFAVGLKQPSFGSIFSSPSQMTRLKESTLSEQPSEPPLKAWPRRGLYWALSFWALRADQHFPSSSGIPHITVSLPILCSVCKLSTPATVPWFMLASHLAPQDRALWPRSPDAIVRLGSKVCRCSTATTTGRWEI